MRIRTLTPMMQPYDSGTCATTCIAMIAGCTLDQAISAAGVLHPSTGTRGYQITKALDRLGIKYGKWRSPYRKIEKTKKILMTKRGQRRKKNLTQTISIRKPQKDIPDFCLGLIVFQDMNSHIVTILDGMVYDPGPGIPIPLRVYEDYFLNRAYAQKGVRAYWEAFLPILSKPPQPPSVIVGT